MCTIFFCRISKKKTVVITLLEGRNVPGVSDEYIEFSRKQRELHKSESGKIHFFEVIFVQK